MKKVVVSLFILFQLEAVLSVPITNLVQNPSFELWTGCAFGDFPADSCVISENEPYINNWKVHGGGVDLLRKTNVVCADGYYCLDLNAHAAGGVSQIIKTKIGRDYLVRFSFSANSRDQSRIRSFTIQAGSTPAQEYYCNSGGLGAPSADWTIAGYFFTASSDETTLTFSSTTNQDVQYNYGPVIDNVIVLPVDDHCTESIASAIVNPSFELPHTPPCPSGQNADYNMGVCQMLGSQLIGWTISNQDVEVMRDPDESQASDGHQSIELNGLFPGTLTQTITVPINKTLAVVWDLSGNPFYDFQKTMVVSVSGRKAVQYNHFNFGGGATDMKYIPVVYTWDSTASSYQLILESTTTTSTQGPYQWAGPYLDNFRIACLQTDAPEEETSKIITRSAYTPRPTCTANILNPSFEVQDCGTNGIKDLSSCTVTSWSDNGLASLVESVWDEDDGTAIVLLSGGATLSQSFATITSATYIVYFSLSGDPRASTDGSVRSLSVQATGNGAQTFQFDTSNTSTMDMGWVQASYSFTASSTTTTLTFTSLNSAGTSGPALDDVTTASAIGAGCGSCYILESGSCTMTLQDSRQIVFTVDTTYPDKLFVGSEALLWGVEGLVDPLTTLPETIDYTGVSFMVDAFEFDASDSNNATNYNPDPDFLFHAGNEMYITVSFALPSVVTLAFYDNSEWVKASSGVRLMGGKRFKMPHLTQFALVGIDSATDRDVILEWQFKFYCGDEDSPKYTSFWSEMRGIKSQNEYECQYVTASNGQETKSCMPSQYATTPVKLRRPLQNDQALWDWRDLVINGDMISARKNCSVVMYERGYLPVRQFDMYNAWPVYIAIDPFERWPVKVMNTTEHLAEIYAEMQSTLTTKSREAEKQKKSQEKQHPHYTYHSSQFIALAEELILLHEGISSSTFLNNELVIPSLLAP